MIAAEKSAEGIVSGAPAEGPNGGMASRAAISPGPCGRKLSWRSPCEPGQRHRRGPWRSLEAIEFATLEWVDWFNNRRLLEPIGNIPPAEAEERYYAMLERHGGVTQTVGDCKVGDCKGWRAGNRKPRRSEPVGRL